MNCAVHPETTATAYCRTCGKAMCSACVRTVKGVVYCEDCIATRLGDTIPPAAASSVGVPSVVLTSGPSPGLAAFLGLIPFGIGAFYNGQFIKGVVHALIFIGLVYGANNVGGGAEVLFGLLIPVWIFYMAFDAYSTAKARQLGKPLPDPFGLNRAFGADVEPSRVPTGAIVLIGLGLLFLANTMGVFQFHWAHKLWPLILIAIGVWLFMKRVSPPPSGDSGPRSE